MKKLITSFVLLFAVALSAFAIHPEKIISQLKEEKGVEKQSISKEDFPKNAEAEQSVILRELEAINVITLEEFSQDIALKYKALFNDLEEADGYETLMRINDEGETVHIMLKTTNDTVEGLYFFAIDDADIVIVELKGNFSKDAIDEFLEEHSEKP
ncbi:DUF4252 domain-containing protein [Dysgonomonas sp. 25]|uniref:DUF4252 domain-containing protein n=1 Tax=Dysgonomonas sp. 25 TaxID=2302933 RepID=UPI0013D058C6|nr:DUF4252 domain-containing protein [Dysgonomonas sp. 25]NDV67340.1 DUF4252 domain-containing protein [Dysgonomonas sp. 25]